MNNPCSECIVTVMCETSCNEFEQYVRDNVDIREVPDDLVSHLCTGIKEGICELYDDDNQWRWKVE